MNNKYVPEGRTLQEDKIENVFKFPKALRGEEARVFGKTYKDLYRSRGTGEKEDSRK